MKTFTPKSPAKSERKWYLVDATDKVVGRLATEVANILRGKNKPSFTPHLDMGDYVIIINAEKVKLSGNKEDQKEFIHHTGYLGHLRRKSYASVKEKNPTRILQEAITGMIPNNRLKKFILEKLSVYAGTEHPHGGQNPITIKL
ncbi:50S ribosomal protein L13 [Patescibacteria group bacterium]|nr:50S ribosomal protein L13 [Patescibacteria group bacterium]